MKRIRFLFTAIAIVSSIAIFYPGPVHALAQGDANGDGKINLSDLIKTEQLILGLGTPTAYADSNCDGIVDVADVTAVERIILGLTPAIVNPVISVSSGYVSDAGYYYVVGDVNNNSSNTIDKVRVDAKFYDAQGELIGQSYAYTAIDTLKPGQWSLFSLNSYPDKYVPASYELSLSWRVSANQTVAGLSILNQVSSYTAEGYLRVTGNVTNQAASTTYIVRLFATYYDSADDIIGYDFAYTNPTSVGPGATAPFQIYSYPKVMKPDHYTLQIQATAQQ